MDGLGMLFDWKRTVGRRVGARRGAHLVVIVAVLCSAGALVNPAPATWAAGTLYVTSFESESEGVYAFAITADGSPRMLPGSPFAAGRGPIRLAITPDGRHLYASNWQTAGTVTAFSVADDGRLSPVLGSPFAAAEGTWGLAITPDGRHLYATNEGVEGKSNNVSAYSIAADGSLTAVPGSPFAAGKITWGVAITPDGRHLYATNGESNNVSAFSIAAEGGLSPVAGSPFAAGQTPSSGVAITPDGRHLYVTSTETNDVSAFSITADGSLTPVAGSPFAAGSSPDGAAISPDGKYLYVIEEGLPCDVRAFSIAADGNLTPVWSSPYPTHTYLPIDVAVGRDGRHLYVTSWGYVEKKYGAGWISAFTIAADGSLTAAPGSPFAMNRALGVVAGPDLPPTAAFSSTPAPVGSTSSFDATASSDPDGTVTSYKWSFGDGQTETTTTPTTTHIYAAARNYTTTLTVTDEAGCSTTQIFSGNTLICDGSPLAGVSHQVPVPTPATLSLELAGSGSGTLTSSPPGIVCPGTCSHVYATGEQVTLAATPTPGSTFAGWSGGDCLGTENCQVSMISDTSVTATFEKLPSPGSTTPGTTITKPPPESIPPPPWTPSEVSQPPSVQNVRQSSQRWRERRRLVHADDRRVPIGTTFSFSLNEQATLSLSFVQLMGALYGTHGCTARAHKVLEHEGCYHPVTRGALTLAGHSGANSVRFAGRISRTDELKPGWYEVVITATNSVGQHSMSAAMTFTVVG